MERETVSVGVRGERLWRWALLWLTLVVLGGLVVLVPGRADPALAVAPSQRLIATTWDWPLRPRPDVVRGFDPPPQRWLPGHRGVDLGGSPGQPVLAAGSGTVVYAGPVAGRGVVSVEHAGGLRTTYEPVLPSVRAGDVVVTGDVVGSLDSGHAGCTREACLHWGLRRGESYLDPLLLTGPLRVRLKPLDGGG